MRKLHKHFLRPRIGLFLVLSLSLLMVCQSSVAVEVGTFSAHVQRIDNNEHILFGYPGHEKIILYRKGYVVGYNPETKVADWVSYHVTAAYLVKRSARGNDFRPDSDLPPGQRAELADYNRSGYDRGHLAPAGDMIRNAQTMSESFLLSNMAPQIGPGFNRGIWKKLETKVRGWVRERKNIYVLTGPIYADPHYKAIGPDRVGVPTHFYKIVVSCSETGQNFDVIAFILPNKRNPDSMLPQFITTIDEVEKLTNLDFLHDLDDNTEFQLEAKKSTMWP